MKQFYTVVLERFACFHEDFTTEPYETGWADEAMFFIRVHEIDKDTKIRSFAQISVDGLVWLDEGTRFQVIDKIGDYFVKVKDFGGWLRLNNLVFGNSSCKVTIHLVLKG